MKADSPIFKGGKNQSIHSLERLPACTTKKKYPLINSDEEYSPLCNSFKHKVVNAKHDQGSMRKGNSIVKAPKDTSRHAKKFSLHNVSIIDDRKCEVVRDSS